MGPMIPYVDVAVFQDPIAETAAAACCYTFRMVAIRATQTLHGRNCTISIVTLVRWSRQ